jgi:hypothetical protein
VTNAEHLNLRHHRQSERTHRVAMEHYRAGELDYRLPILHLREAYRGLRKGVVKPKGQEGGDV